MIGRVWEFYILATSKVISGQVPTYDKVHFWGFYSAAPLRIHTIGTINRCSTQSHFTDTESTSLCAILLMLSARLGIHKYQLHKSFSSLDQEPNLPIFPM